MEVNTQTIAGQETRYKIREPGMYAVILLNDEITTMDFVVMLLVKVFNKPPAEASALMMEIHHNGQGVAGIYTFDIAVTKKAQADRLTAEKGYPLRITIVAEGSNEA